MLRFRLPYPRDIREKKIAGKPNVSYDFSTVFMRPESPPRFFWDEAVYSKRFESQRKLIFGAGLFVMRSLSDVNIY
jgi:hypothetical protein